MGYMGQHTTEQNLKLKKSLKSGRFFLTKKKNYEDHFHWESTKSETSTEPYIELTPQQLRAAKRKRLKPILLYFFLVLSLMGAIILAISFWGW